MAVKGLDIFKLSPKKNCKECGSPTCMAFCMKVAQGALPITKCPYMSPEAIALLSEATAPPMKTLEIAGHKLGGETVLFRHEKTLVSRNLFAVSISTEMDDAAVDAKIEELKKVDYERIGEREYVEFVTVRNCGDNARFVELAKKAAVLERGVILETTDAEAAKAAVEAVKDVKPVVNGVNKDNLEAMNEIASSDYKSDFLGGQNHIALFAEAATKIDMSNAGPYDQGLNESFQNAFKDYFTGNVEEDAAKANFETAIKEKYPELTDVVWPA